MASDPQKIPTMSAHLLRAGLPAFIAGILAIAGLRYAGVPAGVRVGASMFVFLMLQGVLWDRAMGAHRSRPQWIKSTLLLLAGSVLIAFLAQS
jgi:hypothetical protein